MCPLLSDIGNRPFRETATSLDASFPFTRLDRKRSLQFTYFWDFIFSSNKQTPMLVSYFSECYNTINGCIFIYSSHSLLHVSAGDCCHHRVVLPYKRGKKKNSDLIVLLPPLLFHTVFAETGAFIVSWFKLLFSLLISVPVLYYQPFCHNCSHLAVLFFMYVQRRFCLSNWR